ncbi:MAG: metallophosphoesterase family protein [Rhodospirillaceae bacterium]|nr:metallophosphoesterase family protein [Rhodospirillaceae bacterium]
MVAPAPARKRASRPRAPKNRVFKSRRPKARAPSGSVVYAIGDIHGRADLLDALHARIEADAATRDAQRRVLVWLGDYVDRGADPKGVIERVMAPPAGFETVALLGNHEDLMLRFLEDPETGPDWMLNGGAQTLASYQIDMMDGCFFRADRWDALSRALREALPAPQRRFLERLKLTHREGDYFFVHAGVRPDRALDDQDRDDLIWIRGEFLFSDMDYGAVVVHGHTISDEPQTRANRIGIDTGAYYSDRLTALALEGDRMTFLQTGETDAR